MRGEKIFSAADNNKFKSSSGGRHGSVNELFVGKNFICLLLVFLCLTVSVAGQNKGNENAADRTLRGSGRVNASTLGMEIDIPLGGYPGRGINVPINLSYSSKLWRLQYDGDNPIPGSQYSSCYPFYWANFAEESASGWTSSLAVPYIEYPGETTHFNFDGTPVSYYDATCPTGGGGGGSSQYKYIRRLLVHLPGGETHELRPDDTPIQNTIGVAQNPADWDAVYYAVDGSNIKYIQNSATSTYRLLMPDGSFYTFSATNSNGSDRQAVKFTDRNGNFTSYYGPGSVDSNGVTHPNGYWKDTLGRNIPLPLGLQAPNAPTTAQNPQLYSLPGMSGNYKLQWKRLNGGTQTESALTDINDPAYQLKYPGETYECTSGSGYPTYCTRPSGTTLFDGGGGGANPRIVAGDLFNPVVLTEIELPTGQKYQFKYDVYGRIEKIIYPTGGEEVLQYGVVAPLSTLEPGNITNQTNFGVVNRKVYPTSGGAAYQWTYSNNGSSPNNGYAVVVNAPDGTRTERYLHQGTPAGTTLGFGYDNVLAGMAFEERGYSATNQLLSKKLTTWTKTTLGIADWHPRVSQEESIVYDTTGSGVSATVKYEYEGDLNQRETPVLVKKSSQYGFVAAGSALPSAPVRSSETTYLINDTNISQTDRDAYKNQNMVGLATVSEVKDGAGTVVARSEMKYDESGYSPNVGRGNPTTARVWDSTKGASTNPNAYISTRARFDGYGNQYEAIDAKGTATTTVFDSTYQAFPTSVTTVAPDASGVNGSAQGFTTTAVFDPTTGLPTSTVDADGLETRIEYDPVTLRPKNAKTFYQNNQVGSQSETIYNDAPNNYWVKNRTQIDTNKWAESITYFDGLGRAFKSEQVDAQGNVFVEKEFDAEGRVSRVTNPYRANEAKVWTTNVYDEASRLKEVVLPDGAKVLTAYGVAATGVVGITKQITDQAGKKRKGITDALGRMIRVIEDPDGQNLNTDYVFDTLGNLRKTIQGEQSRYFNYDSLGRLLYAKQPEQEANTAFVATDAITSNTSWSVKYVYDDNGNITQTTDARNVSVTGIYDKFNRLIYRDYSDATPDVSFFYDGTGLGSIPAFSKGKTTKVSSSVSETRYTSFDNLGRLLSSEQRTPFSDTETIATATPRTSSYQYNLSGQLTQQTYPSGRVVINEFDADGALSRVAGNATGQTEKTYANSFSYNSAGAVESLKLGNGKWESAKYNNRLQVEQMGLGNSATDTSLLKLSFGYGTATENNSSMRSQTITVPSVGGNAGFTATQSYAYDNLNRLQSATETVSGSQTWKQTFSFDRYGNRRYDAANTTTLGSCSQAECNPLINTSDNRISNSQGYAYDKNGNLTLDAENQRFVYDAESKQTQFFKGTNNTSTPDATYLYDGEGKRVKKITFLETTVFVYDGGGQLVAEYSTQISATPQTSYLTSDHLGSPRVVTNQLGQVISRKDFRAFGEESLTSQRTSGLGYDPLNAKSQPEEARQDYTGYEKDEESGLEYAQARYYNSSHGRFTSVDPLTASASIRDPQTFNRYSYVLNSPYKFTDPLGLLPKPAKDCTKSCVVNGERYFGDDFLKEQQAKQPEPPPPPQHETLVHEVLHSAEATQVSDDRPFIGDMLPDNTGLASGARAFLVRDDGLVAHDGQHILSPKNGGTAITITGLTGSVIRWYDQGDGTHALMILLDNGQVAVYKDLVPNSVNKSVSRLTIGKLYLNAKNRSTSGVRLEVGDTIGETRGWTDPSDPTNTKNDRGLHFTLLKGVQFIRPFIGDRQAQPSRVSPETYYVDPCGIGSPVRCK